MHGLKKFHDFSVNSWAPLSICCSDSQCSHSSSIHESTVCRVYIMHGHTETTTQSNSSPRAKPTTTPPPWPATALVTRGSRAFPAVYRLVEDHPARRERVRGMREGEVAALVSQVSRYGTPKRCAPLSLVVHGCLDTHRLPASSLPGMTTRPEPAGTPPRPSRIFCPRR